jgi:hypothetical protein
MSPSRAYMCTSPLAGTLAAVAPSKLELGCRYKHTTSKDGEQLCLKILKLRSTRELLGDAKVTAAAIPEAWQVLSRILFSPSVFPSISTSDCTSIHCIFRRVVSSPSLAICTVRFVKCWPFSLWFQRCPTHLGCCRVPSTVLGIMRHICGDSSTKPAI